MTQINKWQCPVCKHTAYQKYGSIPVHAKKVNEVTGLTQDTIVNMGSYFICKGCSVHFSNPYHFNAAK